MDRGVDSFSSSSSQYLKNKLGETRAIKEDGFEQSSILDCLQAKINQLLHFQEEAISLKAQVKILEETRDLQEAEFSFQRKEMQAQIEHLREVETSLRNALQSAESNKTYGKFDVEARIKKESSEMQQLSDKIMKTKEKKSALKSENESLREQLSQMSSEYEQLKEENYSLKNDFSSISQSLQQERNNSRILNENQNKSMEESRLINESMESIQSENQQLKEQLSKIQEDMENKSKLNKSLKSAIKESNAQQQETVDKLRKQISNLKSQNTQLDMQLKKANKMSQQLKEQTLDLSETNKTFQETKEDVANQISNLEFENQQLKSKIELQEKQLQDYHELKKEVQEQKSLLDHIELEKKNLSNIAQVESDPIDGTWANLVEKMSSALEAQSIVKTVKEQNEKLKTRLKSTLDISNFTTAPSQMQNVDDEDQYVEALKSTIDKAQEKINKYEDELEESKFQKQFSYIIDSTNTSLFRDISNLYLSIYPMDDSMRSIIMAVIFAKRLLVFKKSNTFKDIHSLLCFKGRPNKSPLYMVNAIKRRMASLTHELIDTKEQLVKAIEEKETLELESGALKAENNSTKDELRIAKKKTRYLKKRMIELQQELALLVPAEEYQHVCQLVKESELKEQELTEIINKQKETISETNSSLEELKKDKENNERKANQNEDIANDLNDQMLQKEKELETLKIILSEKNKEIIALERVVNRQKAIERTATAAFANLSLGENTDISFDPKIETATLCNQEPSYSHNINPAFLN